LEQDMARILGIEDNLDEIAARFAQAPLPKPVFLNSVPKSGTHLLLNIVRMFTPPGRYFSREAIQLPNLRQFFAAFSPKENYLSWGHLLFDDQAALAMKWVRHVVLVRDPYDLVLARARFYLSDEFQGDLNHIKNGTVSAEQIMNMMIFGVFQKAPSLLDTFMFNAVAWMGTDAKIVKYEDIRAHVKALDTPEAEAYFRALLGFCGVDLPADWRERVRIGADPKNSRTARQNLTGFSAVTLPDVLPEAQKKLVDFAAPGLRALLGYE
jgi:hypothetical protein